MSTVFGAKNLHSNRPTEKSEFMKSRYPVSPCSLKIRLFYSVCSMWKYAGSSASWRLWLQEIPWGDHNVRCYGLGGQDKTHLSSASISLSIEFIHMQHQLLEDLHAGVNGALLNMQLPMTIRTQGNEWHLYLPYNKDVVIFQSVDPVPHCPKYHYCTSATLCCRGEIR